MGRSLAINMGPKLNLPGTLDEWNDDHRLSALVAGSFDVPGHVLYGARNLAKFRLESGVERKNESIFSLPALAEQAMANALSRSLAGGEQPKFTALLKLDGELAHAIVKFSPKGSDPVAARWKDLLIAEHIALETLLESDIASANTTWREDKDQVFLISERFDRVGVNGRLPMVSLASFCKEHLGDMQNWSATALQLLDAGHITGHDAARMALLDVFGSLIGNTDRHFGNLSLIQYPDSGGQWSLAPTYDMLPMVFAPKDGVAPPLEFDPSRVAPTLENEHVWDDAANLAGYFWQRLSEAHGVSDAMRKKAEELTTELPYDAVVSRPMN